MKKTQTFLLMALAVMTILCFNACGSSEPGPDTSNKLELKTNQTSIFPDGVDLVSFTVEYDGQNVTSQAIIFNTTLSQQVIGTEFKSTTPGTYEFYAEYEGVQSTKVAITVKDKVANGLVLHPSQDYFIPDGQDEVSFTVLYNYEDVTAESKITNVTDNVVLTDKTFKSDLNKTYILSVEYKEEKITNFEMRPVPFHHRVAMLKLTGTWCKPCHVLHEGIEKAWSDIGEKVTITNVHESSTTIDPFEPNAGLLADLNKYYFPTALGYPTVNYNLVKSVEGGRNAAQVRSYIAEFDDYYATSGIKASSTLTGNSLNVDIEIWVNEKAEYSVAAILNESGLVGTQNGATGEFIHNDVLRDVKDAPLGKNVGVIEADSKTQISYTFDVSKYKSENCSIMILVFKKGGDGLFVDNSANCPVSGSIDYKFVSL